MSPESRSEESSSSHVGIGLAAGAILGLAAGLFLQSRKGKELTRDAQKKASQLQAKVMKKLKSAEHLTKEKYADVVEDVLAYYAKSKDLAQKELPQVRTFLMGKWKSIETELKKIK